MNIEEIFVSVPTSPEERKRYVKKCNDGMSQEDADEMIRDAVRDHPVSRRKKGRFSKYVSCYLKGMDDALILLQEDLADYIKVHPELKHSVFKPGTIEEFLHHNSATWTELKKAVVKRISGLAQERYSGKIEYLYKAFEELLDLFYEIDYQQNTAVFGKIADIQERYSEKYRLGDLGFYGDYPEEGRSWESCAGMVYAGSINRIMKTGIEKEDIQEIDHERDFLLDEMRRQKEIVTDEDIDCIMRRFSQKHPVRSDEAPA